MKGQPGAGESTPAESAKATHQCDFFFERKSPEGPGSLTLEESGGSTNTLQRTP
jgi:hypothetical protein